MNIKNLTKRSISAFFFTIIIITALLLNKIVFGITFGLLMIIALHETYQIIEPKQNKAQEKYGITVGSIIYIISYLVSQKIAPPTTYLILAPLFITFFMIEIFQTNKQHSIPKTVFGIIYVAIPFALFNFLNTAEIWNAQINQYFLLYFFIIIWANDTGAYLIGSLIGKNPFSKNISPNKTIEGTLGGIITSTIIAIIPAIIYPELCIIKYAGLGLIIAISGTYGDLAESMLKRRANVKDSGKIMPGHGGILDRFDSFIFAVPMALLYIKALEIFN